MQKSALTKIKIIQKLYSMSEKNIEAIQNFIDSISNKENLSTSIDLKGIWKDKGFEKINNLENDLNEIRKKMTNSTLNRNL
ncbi:MAG: hypothetical protein KAS64_01710 [Spirochaetes bacterium]|nr:hypothetical protein [Spirochaetota bacterium]